MSNTELKFALAAALATYDATAADEAERVAGGWGNAVEAHRQFAAVAHLFADAARIALAAIDRLADTAADMGADVAPSMTCGEAEALADVLALVDADAAARWIADHATDDDDGDMAHAPRRRVVAGH